MRRLEKKKVSELQIDYRVKEVLLKVLGPEEEVYVEQVGGKLRIIL